MANRICVKVDNLRKNGYQSLKDWMNNENNVYVGRYGRIFITDKITKEKEIFHYSGSKFANPFKVTKECDVETCVKKYEKWLRNNAVLENIEELRDKNLGCFCNSNSKCHVDVLIKLLKENDGEYEDDGYESDDDEEK